MRKFRSGSLLLSTCVSSSMHAAEEAKREDRSIELNKSDSASLTGLAGLTDVNQESSLRSAELILYGGIKRDG